MGRPGASKAPPPGVKSAWSSLSKSWQKGVPLNRSLSKLLESSSPKRAMDQEACSMSTRKKVREIGKNKASLCAINCCFQRSVSRQVQDFILRSSPA